MIRCLDSHVALVPNTENRTQLNSQLRFIFLLTETQFGNFFQLDVGSHKCMSVVMKFLEFIIFDLYAKTIVLC